MRMIAMDGYGGPDVLHLAEAPLPQVADGMVRVRVTAAGVNPADFKWRTGMFEQIMPVRFPHVLGYDIAGTIDAVADAVTGFAIGDRVCAMLDTVTKGGYAEYAAFPAAAAVRLPAELDFAEAAALPTPALTGVQLIEHHVRPEPGQTVLVTGAVGAVGRFATFACRAGVRVVAAVRAAHREEALEAGADEVVLLDGGAWRGAPFDHVADTVGGDAVAILCRAAAPGARIVTVSTTPIPAEGLPSQPQFIGVRQDPERLVAILQAVAAGKIRLPVARKLPLSHAAEAHRLVAAGGIGGKIILIP